MLVAPTADGDGYVADVFGLGEVDGVGAHWFHITALDYGESGRPDAFHIRIYEGSDTTHPLFSNDSSLLSNGIVEIWPAD